MPAGVGPVQFARGTSGVRRWYRRVAGPRRTSRRVAAERQMIDRGSSARRRATIAAMELPAAFDGRPGADRHARAARCATCASRSPIAATSAARTACRRRSSAATTSSCPATRSCSFEEIERVARAFVALGVEKLRITGGEPLVRRDLPDLIGDAGRAPPARRRRDRPDPHDQRLGAAGAGRDRSPRQGCGG